MAACEKCWNDAYARMLADPSKSQTEHYYDLLKERKDHPCSSDQERAEQVWDDLGHLNPENPQDDAINLLAAYGQEQRREGVEAAFGMPGKITTVDKITWRGFGGQIAPRYCLRIEVEYDCMIDRDIAGELLNDHLLAEQEEK
jgi:hypothetical protein